MPRRPGALPQMRPKGGSHGHGQAIASSAGSQSATTQGSAGMACRTEETVCQFMTAAYARIDMMVHAHSAADAAGKRAIEAHIAATFEEIVAVELLAELLGLGW